MKKNFLLLFLMALLPLAGWAANLVEIGATLVAPSFTFGGNHALKVIVNGTTLTQGANKDYILVGYYKDNKGAPGEEYTGTLGTAPKGTYWVKVTGVNDYEGELTASFIIDPAPLYISITAVAKTYGDDPTTTYTYAVKDAEDNDVANEVVEALDIDVFVKNGEGTKFTPAKTTDVGDYDFGFTFDDSGNYTLNRATETTQYVISPKAISALTAEMAEGTYTYTGNDIVTPTFTVTDGETPVTTYTVQWFAIEPDANTPDNQAVTPKNAGTYYARLVGSGNYGGKAVNTTDWKIVVARVPLNILVNPLTKTYDGIEYTAANVDYTFGGLVEADQGKVNKATITPKVDGAAWANFKNYKAAGYVISADASAATIGDPAINLNTNYNVTVKPSVWKISQAELTIKAADVSIGYGDDIPNAIITAEGAIESEADAIAADFEATSVAAIAAGAVNNAYGVQPNVYVPVRKSPASDDVTALLNNYDWDIAEAVKGNLIIGGEDFTIMPIFSTVTYDGQEHAATGYYANVGSYVLTSDDVDEKTISYEYKNITAGETEFSKTLPKAVGVYRVRVAKGVQGKGNFAEFDADCQEIEVEIKKKPITITITGATLHNGDTEETLKNHTTYSEYTLVPKEEIEFKPVFVRDGEGNLVTGLTEDAETKKITITGDIVNNAVIAVLVDGDNNNGNYDVTFIAGNLKKAADALVLAKADDDLDTAIKEASLTGNLYDVTFDNSIDMLEKNWYAMVLPFDVTPAELVGKLGTYVVVNTLSSSTMEEKNGKQTVDVKFKLEMDNIPAGTPFIIKPAQAVNWFQDANTDDVNDIVFTTEDITYDITDAVSDHATFTGTYKTNETVKWGQNVDGEENADAKYRWLCDKTYSDGTRNAWLNPKSSAHDLTAMEAYLILDAGAQQARIFVEDFDGNTTSIQSLSVDDIQGLKVAEGWYTLGGVKLQAAPTEKGVYIKDGKKFVIK